MSWTSKSIAGAVATAAFLATAGVAAAGTIVVKSSGPSATAYPPGKPIADNSKVALKAGDQVTILDGRGTRVFKGPGVFSTTASTATNSSIGSVLKNTGARQVRTGAVRGAGTSTASAKPTNVWFIDATKPGAVCYAGTEGLQLWMPAAAEGGTLTVTRASDGKAVPLTLRAGQQAKLWPSEELPVADGSEFSLSGAAMPAPVTIKFASLGADPQGLEATAAGMIRAGCNAQLDRLIEMVAVPAAYDDAPTG